MAAVGDAQQQQPGDPEQRAAGHVTEPMRAQVEAGKTDHTTTTPPRQVGPYPLAPRQLARDQHGEETEADGGHGHRDRREAEARPGRWAGWACPPAHPGRRSAPARRPARRASARPRSSAVATAARPAPVRRRGPAPAASPRDASAAISRSASGLRSEDISACTFMSMSSGSPRASSTASQREPAPADGQQACRQDGQRWRLGSIGVDQRDGVAAQRGCARLQRSARASSASAWSANQR